MFRTLLTYPRSLFRKSQPKLRAMLSGGEVLAPALAHAMGRFAPAAIHDLYGLTETGSCDFHLGPADQPQGFGTIGHPTDRVAFRIARGRRAPSRPEKPASCKSAPRSACSVIWTIRH